MKILYHVLFLVGTVVQFQKVKCIHSPPINRIDHLPTNIKPELYELTIYTDPLNNVIPFRGEVRITISCKINTDTVILNVKDLKIHENSITVGPPQYTLQPHIEIKSRFYRPLQDQYVITLTEELQADHSYEVFISFKKESLVDLSDRGFIRHGYRRVPGQVKNIVMITKTEINDARRYFPCIDEMKLKSNFRVRVAFAKHAIPIGSTAFRPESLTLNTESHTIMGEFEESVSISTHSLSLIIANLKEKKVIEKSTDTTIMIWSDSDENSARMDFISEMSLKVLKFFLRYFRSYSPISNLNILGLPKFQETNTEKYGLILLDESTLSTSELLDDDKKAEILLQLCYETSRQWIGASATMAEWNEYWVHRALATVLRAECFNELITEEKSNPLDWYLVEAFTHVLSYDGESVARPVHVEEENFDLTEAFSDSVLTDKAYLLIRMLYHILGKDDFQKAVKTYYKTFKNKNSRLDQVWEIFKSIREENPDLHPHDTTTIEKIMDSWIRKKRYPLVTMSIVEKQQNTVILTQEPFVQLEDEGNATKIIREKDHWIIPLSYATKTELKNKDIKEFPVNLWLRDEPQTLTYADEWILLNLHLNVLCRVNYPKEMWASLRKTLMDKVEYTIIDDLSRVQLIVDMFALAAVDKLPYEDLIDTMVYLRHEYSDLPLTVALQELNKIRLALYDSKVLEYYKNYVREILEPIFERQRFVKIDDLPQNNKKEYELKKLVIEVSCNFGVKSCVKQAEDLLKDYITHDYSDEDNKIPEDIREIVYCQGIKQGGKEEWEFLSKKYNKRRPEEHNKIILAALGCTTDENTLTLYLHRFVDDEFPPHLHPSIISGLASNEAGYGMTKTFFISEVYYGTIKSLYGYENTIGLFLVKLFEFTNNEDDFNDLKGTMESIKHHLTGVESLLRENIRMAKRNTLWRTKHEDTLFNIFEDEVGVTA